MALGEKVLAHLCLAREIEQDIYFYGTIDKANIRRSLSRTFLEYRTIILELVSLSLFCSVFLLSFDMTFYVTCTIVDYE